jgi:hypothetical protein
MLIRTMVARAVVVACLSAFSLSQQAQAPSARPVLHEFPLTLQQSLESGKAAIGTKVQARLASPTKFQGTNIPRNAVFSGVVIESTAKGPKEPAKLAIRMEKAEWKEDSISLTAYLLPLSYSNTAPTAQGLPNESPGPSSRTSGAGEDANSSMRVPFPTNDSQAAQAAIPEAPTLSSRPVQMKNVTVALADEGGAALVSEHNNIKLYKMTTYVFAATELPAKQ